MNQALIISVAMLLFGLLAAYNMSTLGPGIEALLQKSATEAIEAAGLNWVTVGADGNVITMRGKAPSQAARSDAMRAVRRIAGVRRIINEMQLSDEIFAPVTPAVVYESRITVNPGFVEYSGFVPSDMNRKQLIDRTRKLYEGRRVEDEMVVRDGAPDGWMEAMTSLQQRFSTYNSAEGVISGTHLNVIGSVAPGREGETKLLASRLPGNFVTEIKLSVNAGESAAACQARLDDLMQQRINFQAGSAVIDPGSHDLLNRLGKRIGECGGLRIEVAGHTDSAGLAMKNLELSQRRAEAVAAYLVERGLDPDQLVPWGYGESRPIDDNATARGRAANRRIEFIAMD